MKSRFNINELLTETKTMKILNLAFHFNMLINNYYLLSS